MGSVRYGRYETIRLIAAGGMATVHLGRATGAGGFERLVAIKVMHPHIAHESEFVAMLLDEARLAARIRHPHVVPTLDVAPDGRYLVMEYVEGASLYAIVKTLRKAEGVLLPVPCVLRIMIDGLAGLHAAHELTGDDGAGLNIVHRDMSPQNVLVGVDGIARITDFGVAHAESRISSTRGGQLKGKLPYMAPEQLRSEPVDRRTDVYAAGVVMWEVLTGRSLFRAANDAALACKVLDGPERSPRQLNGAVPQAIDEVCMQALMPVDDRYATAEQFSDALEDAAQAAGVPVARRRVVGGFARDAAGRVEEVPDWSRPDPSSQPGSAPLSTPADMAAAPAMAERIDSALMPGAEPEPPTVQASPAVRAAAVRAAQASSPNLEPEPPTVQASPAVRAAAVRAAQASSPNLEPEPPTARPSAAAAPAEREPAEDLQATQLSAKRPPSPAADVAPSSEDDAATLVPASDSEPPTVIGPKEGERRATPGVAATLVDSGPSASEHQAASAAARAAAAQAAWAATGTASQRSAELVALRSTVRLDTDAARSVAPAVDPRRGTPVSGISPALSQRPSYPDASTPVSGVAPVPAAHPSWPSSTGPQSAIQVRVSSAGLPSSAAAGAAAGRGGAGWVAGVAVGSVLLLVVASAAVWAMTRPGTESSAESAGLSSTADQSSTTEEPTQTGVAADGEPDVAEFDPTTPPSSYGATGGVPLPADEATESDGDASAPTDKSATVDKPGPWPTPGPARPQPTATIFHPDEP